MKSTECEKNRAVVLLCTDASDRAKPGLQNFTSLNYTALHYTILLCTVSVLGREGGYTVKYTPSPEGVPEGEARGNS